MRQKALHLWQTVYAPLSKLFDRVMERVDRRDALGDFDFVDFERDARWTMAQQTPRGARWAVWGSLMAVVVLVVWAAVSPLDEVARGEGKVIPSRQLQVMQAMDGGIVSELAVRPGQLVEAGQLLLRIDSTRFVSSFRENRSQYLSLQAKAARLKALAEGKDFVAPAEAVKEIPDTVEQERQLWRSRRRELDATMGIAREQLVQRSQELNEVRARRDQASRSYDLTVRELDVTRPLAKTGAVSDVELLRLERDVARYRGERDASNAQIPRIQASISEAQRKLQEVELNFRNEAQSELSEVRSKLKQLSAGSEGLADRVKQSEIRSPVRGTVNQLLVNTVGGVVQPGKEVVEIVPADDALLLEARVLPKDIAFLRPGQKALVKFTAYDFAVYGGLEAVVEHIGADTVTDDKGNAFYVIRVRTLKNTSGQDKFPIIPGMVAEVDVLTGKKSILSYLLKPVLRAKSVALTER